MAAIHRSESDDEPLGAGVAIDSRRVLTCAHVVPSNRVDREELWVAFPFAEPPARRRCRVQSVVTGDDDQDVALLVLNDPVPAGVTAARLKRPGPKDLVGTRWWAYGWPRAYGSEGSSAEGKVGTHLASGRIRIHVGQEGYPVEAGFSGGGLWSPDFQAVVGIVAVADPVRGYGAAITLHQVDRYLPDAGLRELTERSSAADSGEVALTAWGWSLTEDKEGVRHWRPRARGVSVDSERGYRFRGRTAALREVTSWLDRDLLDAKVLIVTGAPGSGKSAVLGRIVTTADMTAAANLPEWDTAVRATAGSVACAVHAKGKSALDIANEIARAAAAALPERLEDFPPALHETLASRHGRFNVIIDALDEAAEVRTVIADVISPVAETCADVGAQVVVGSRRRDNDGDLLSGFGAPVHLVDLDAPGFFAEADLVAYAQAALQIERPGNPYADSDAAFGVAARIAALSEGNFLFAGLTARYHGLYDEKPANPAALSFTGEIAEKIAAVVKDHLKRLKSPMDVPSTTLLTALALTEAPGLPVSLWREAIRVLSRDSGSGAGDVPELALTRFARSTAAANFLVESSGEAGQAPVFRLFHQALNDALVREGKRTGMLADEDRAVTKAFIAYGRAAGWENAPAYLLRSLPAHAARTGMMDDLLTDDTFLLYANLRRLLPLASRATTAGGQRVRLLRLASRKIIEASAPERAALLGVTETLEDLGNAYTRADIRVPYRAVWAAATRGAEQQILEGPGGPIHAVCAFGLGGRTLLATGNGDGTVRVWDPATGAQDSAMHGHEDAVRAVCAFGLGDRTLLATGSSDGSLRTWDPATGTKDRAMHGHEGAVRAVCAFTIGERTLLATGSSDLTVRVWDPATGTQEVGMSGHADQVTAVCAFTAGGRTLLATGSNDRTVRTWDPVTGAQERTMHGHTDQVMTVCAFDLDGRTLLATGSRDGTVRLWDPATGTPGHVLHGHAGPVRTVSVVTAGDQTLLATGSLDRTVRLWDPATGTQLSTLHGHTDEVTAGCAFGFGSQALLASGSLDRTVRLWDLATATQDSTALGHTRQVHAVCAFAAGGRTLLGTGSSDRAVRLWDPATGTQERTLPGHTRQVRAVCAFTIGERTLLATGGLDGTVRTWDPATGTPHGALAGYTDWVYSLCAFELGGRTLLATGSRDGTVRTWDPCSGTQERAMTGSADWIRAVCAFGSSGRTLLAAGSKDGTVCLWDPATGTQERTLDSHSGEVSAVCAYDSGDRTLLATGSSGPHRPPLGPRHRHSGTHPGRPFRRGQRRLCP